MYKRHQVLATFAALIPGLAPLSAQTAFEATLHAPKTFSRQDAAVYAHELERTLEQMRAREVAYQATLEYLADYLVRLERKQQRTGLLPFESELLPQVSVRRADATLGLKETQAKIATTEAELARWRERADPASLIRVEPGYRLFPEKRPMPTVHLPAIDAKNGEFKLSVTTKNSLRL